MLWKSWSFVRDVKALWLEAFRSPLRKIAQHTRLPSIQGCPAKHTRLPSLKNEDLPIEMILKLYCVNIVFQKLYWKSCCCEPIHEKRERKKSSICWTKQNEQAKLQHSFLLSCYNSFQINLNQLNLLQWSQICLHTMSFRKWTKWRNEKKSWQVKKMS